MWKEEERKKNNAKFSGHYVCPRTHFVHTNSDTFNSYQFVVTRQDSAMSAGSLNSSVMSDSGGLDVNSPYR